MNKKLKLITKYLSTIPVVNIPFEKDVDTQRITLAITRDKFFDKVVCWLFSKPKIGYVPLDEMSSLAFALADGRKNLEEISLLLNDLKPDDSLTSMQLRVVKFFNYLNFNRWVKLEKAS